VRREVEEQLEEEKRQIRAQAEEARATLEEEARLMAANIRSQVLRR